MLVSRSCSVIRRPDQCRYYSNLAKTYEIPDIHFGKELSPSSSKPHFTLRTSLYLPITLHRVWDNFHVPTTLNAITPPHLNFAILSPQPVQMREGTIIDYRCSQFTQTAPLTAVTNSSSIKAEVSHCSTFNVQLILLQLTTSRHSLQMAHKVRCYLIPIYSCRPREACNRFRISRWDPPHGFQDEQVSERRFRAWAL